MATVVRFQAKPSQASFLPFFDSLVAITTHPGAQNSISGSFGADNDDAGQTDKPIALLRFVHACGVMNALACRTLAVKSSTGQPGYLSSVLVLVL